MRPRINLPLRLGVSHLCFRPAPVVSKVPLSVTSIACVSSQAEKKRRRDPYALAQARQKKAANLRRQEELKAERQSALGDPVRGITTPFVESFDTVGGSSIILDGASIKTSSGSTKSKDPDDMLLNHFLTASELEQSVKHSYTLSEPVVPKIRDVADPASEAAAKREHAEGHARAVAALSRITILANGSQQDKTRANIQRCIETFGRHNTDANLNRRPPTNPSLSTGKPALPEKTPRAGPDTGSPEVQIAIWTAKIRVLANQLEARGGNRDKVNKRNLRLLVHKRQKMLNYLRLKERGGDRWQHLVSTLGLADGTWKGEITL